MLSVSLFSQEYNIDDFSNPYKYGWKTPEQRNFSREYLKDRQHLLQLYEINKQDPTSNFVKSLILPGWGHFSSKRYSKGQILLGLEIAFWGTSYYFYDKSMEDYKKYKSATYIDDMNQYYLDARTPYMYSQGFFILGMLVWVYTVFDTIKVTEDNNIELWNSIFDDAVNKKIIITPSGVTVRF
jgi:hypothetical protein